MKFSIVTPVLNSEKFIAETIESVIFQKGDFSIEYKIIDNCSVDDSIKVVNRYKKLLEKEPWLIKCNKVEIEVISESDTGMYDAINNGFSKSSGDIFAYINSDDIYLPGAFSIMSSIFSNHKEVNWLKGTTSYINTSSVIYRRGNINLYYSEWIRKGLYGTSMYFIQQDSTFWRADLWHKVGEIDDKLKLAGDFYLWVNFAKYTKLYTVDVDVSCFRKVDNQLSMDIDKYYSEVNKITKENITIFEKFKLKIFFYFLQKIKSKLLKKILYRSLFPSHRYSYFNVEEKNEKLVETKTFITEAF